MFENRLEFKGAVIGMVLGDATIAHRERKTAHLQFSHRKADEDYVKYKVKMLNWLNETKYVESSTKAKGITYPCVVGRTLSHPFYTSLGQHMYYDGRKTVNEHVMKCLTPLGLALWYCDDGTLAGEVGFRNPFLCTHNFNQVENELLARMVHKKFGVTFRVTTKNTKNGTYYWLRLRRKDREAFFDIIKEFIPKCMERKISPDFYKSDEKYHIVETPEECKTCGELFLKKQRSINTFCSPECLATAKTLTRKSNAKASAQKAKIESEPDGNTGRCQK